MNALPRRIAALALIAGSALLAGCNALNNAIPDEVKFGQVYMLESVLSEATNQCDSEHLFDARQWSLQLTMTLRDFLPYVDSESATAREGYALLSQLSRINGYGGAMNCGQIPQVMQQTRVLLAALREETLVVASR